ncbi:MAG: cytochrome b5 domain-containing protein [Patescibacteria group bacterium]|nr:cytochrome b5 domain-containing protein [Patescibacteria group bacterium]
MKKLLLISGIALLAAGCNSSQPTQTTATQTQPSQQLATYTLAQVQSADSAQKCWTAINGNVYDLTKWIDQHPGGDKNILKICGKDGTQAFEKQHGGQSKPEQTLKGFQIGILK